MKPCLVALTGVLCLHALPATSAPPPVELPAVDQRSGPVRTLNTPRTFPAIASRDAWEKRARGIREQILVGAGLWPLGNRPPVNHRIYDRIERDGYSVEKVWIETHPGFYLGGNLYRPTGRGPGPFPAILNPHGHWASGRLEDGTLGSIPARCINFALQGMIALSIDMVGYNDTQFAGRTHSPPNAGHRDFGGDPALQPWGLSLMGLQLWNTIRALDLLESLPDVDRSRLGCTGASGGGTQTFMLAAVDDRLAAVAPCVMVSHSMQGGCLCENMPGLRVEYSNMEIAAAAAPRPQLMVAATGDWTKTTETIEGPAVGGIYQLFGQPEHHRHVTLPFEHNYNRQSREQVYGWFARWFLKAESPAPVAEKAFRKEPNEDLLAFARSPRPTNTVSPAQLAAHLVNEARRTWESLQPINPPLLEQYKARWLPAWRATLQVSFVETGLVVATESVRKTRDFTATRLALGRLGRGDRLPAVLLTPAEDSLQSMVVLADPAGSRAFLDDAGAPRGLAQSLLQKGQTVLLVDAFQTGAAAVTNASKRDYLKDFYTTYNRTEAQERVQDLVTACAFAQAHRKGTRKVILCGTGRAGLWAMLASPATDAVVADCAGLDTADDAAWLARDVLVPGLRRLGGFEGVLQINTGHPLLLHNTAGRFETAHLAANWERMHVPRRLRIEAQPLEATAVADWIVGLQR